MCKSWSYQLLMSCGGLLVAATIARGEVSSQALDLLASAQLGGDSDQGPLSAAWREVVTSDVSEVPDILAAFDDASSLGANWLSSALDEVLQRGKAHGQSPDSGRLTELVLDTGHSPLGRETALELLRSQEPAAAELAIGKLINDPSARMRRPAVQKLIELAKKQTDSDRQLSTYRQAFEAARDEDHVAQCAVALRELGQPVDHIKKFGFLMRWQIIGPFDFQDGDGFDAVYPPESLDLTNYAGEQGIFSNTTMAGKEAEVAWHAYVNTARNGVVDLNKAIDELRDVVAYGATVFESERQRDVQFRLRQQNACQLWLNGELVFEQPIGHTGNFFDQYTVPVTLRQGPNLILIKSCQVAGPVEHPFLKNWQFGVRVCDATGAAVLSQNRLPTPELDPLPSTSTSESEADESDDELAAETALPADATATEAN